MKTLGVLYAINNKKKFNWSDFTTPLMVTDDKGVLYVIVDHLFSDVLDVVGEDTPLDFNETTYFIVNLVEGELNPNGFSSIKSVIDAYSEVDIKLMPVQTEILVREYLEIKESVMQDVNS